MYVVGNLHYEYGYFCNALGIFTDFMELKTYHLWYVYDYHNVYPPDIMMIERESWALWGRVS